MNRLGYTSSVFQKNLKIVPGARKETGDVVTVTIAYCDTLPVDSTADDIDVEVNIAIMKVSQS